MRTRWLGAVVGLSGVANAAEPPREVTLVLVVDQLPEARVDTLLAHLSPWLGGRATSRYAHATTVTCVGHVTIATGLSPRDHGVVINRWYPGGEGDRPVDCLSEGTGIAAGVPTLATVARAGEDPVWTAAVALKRRSAIPLGGGPEYAVWYDVDAGRFVGGDELVGGAAARAAADASVAAAWEWRAADFAIPDARVGEGVSRYGVGACAPGHVDVPSCRGEAVFPYVIDGRAVDARDVLWDPHASDALVAAADAVLDTAPGRRGLLGVSFSEIDVVGHAWTGDSLEYAAALDHLGEVLADWFARLDARGIRWRAVLTADHGALGTPTVLAPESGADAGPGRDPAAWLGGRASWRDAERAVASDTTSRALFDAVAQADPAWVANRVLVSHGVTHGLAREVAPLLWLPPLSPELRAQVVAEVGAALLASRAPVRGGEPQAPYAAVLDVRDGARVVAGSASPEVVEAVAASVPPGVADLYVLLAPGAVVVDLSYNALGLGSDHGTPWDYDRDVPLLLFGDRAARRWPATVDARQVAPTAAALLGPDVLRALEAGRPAGVSALPALPVRPRRPGPR